MARPIAIVGAPSSIGTRPYDDGAVRHMNRAPSVLRERGVIGRLRAVDLGDVSPPPYRDFVPPPRGARNEAGLVMYSRALASRVSRALDNGHFAVVLGGDCSIVLGCLLAARRRTGTVGLAYVDAHADFATPDDAPGTSASNMTLSFAVGRGMSALAHLGGATPLVDPGRTALIGRRGETNIHGSDELAAASILEIPSSQIERGIDLLPMARRALLRVAPNGMGGFWIHVDADVLNPLAMAAVGSPEPGGPTPDQLITLLRPLIADPHALGLSLSVYDPALDPDRSGARQLVNLLVALLDRSTPH